LLGRFQTGRDAVVEPIRAKPRSAQNGARPALKTLSGQGRGGAVRKAESAPVEDSWEEF